MRFFESLSARVNREAVLITYYGFLSVFPLLLLSVGVLSRVLADNRELRQRLIAEIVTVAAFAGGRPQLRSCGSFQASPRDRRGTRLRACPAARFRRSPEGSGVVGFLLGLDEQ
jgi:hypothetical protein